MQAKASRFNARWDAISWIGLLLFAGTGAWNISVIAMDDYYDVIAHIIPAQQHSFSELLAIGGFRSPIPRLFLLCLTKFAYFLGLEDPISQLRLVLMLWGAFSYALIHFCLSQLTSYSKNETLTRVTISLFSFFFACPLLLSRPMIESLCTPFILASLAAATHYWVSESRKALLFSVILLWGAFLFRFQSIVCLPAIVLLPLLRSRLTDFNVACLAATCGFFAVGWIDSLISGNFHQTFSNYLSYNVSHSSSHGVTPFYSYFLLFISLSFPPAFLSTYRKLSWKKYYQPLIPALLFFLSFLIIHSAVPHKEERFMIPLLPIFLVLLAPMAYSLWVVERVRWRWVFFWALNGLLLALVSTNIAQNNVIGMMRYLQSRSDVKKVLVVDDSVVLFPKAFVVRSIEKYNVSVAQWREMELHCGQVTAIRSLWKDRLTSRMHSLRLVGQFEPGWIEALVVKLNPKRNARRSAVALYERKDCPASNEATP